MVARWKLNTRSALSGTTSARWRTLSWVETPVGHLSVWQDCDWMQPSANMKPRAELHQSAPSAMARAMSKALTILPAAPSLMRSRTLMPISALCKKLSPSRHAEMVEELEWRRAGAAFRAIDHDEVRIDSRLQHRLANRQKFPLM